MLVTGAGPIGLLGAMLGVQRGFEVHVLDQVSDGPKPQLVEDLGATYHSGDIADAMGKTRAEAILEATGVGKLVFDAMDHLAPGGIVCLTGLSPAGGTLSVEAGSINRDLVLQNNVVLGSVNANHRHYQAAAEALAAADRSWLERLITRTVPLENYVEALETRPDDVKVVIERRRRGLIAPARTARAASGQPRAPLASRHLAGLESQQPLPRLKRVGGAVIGSVPMPRRRRASLSVSPV